jgi:hypothetical protein
VQNGHPVLLAGERWKFGVGTGKIAESHFEQA